MTLKVTASPALAVPGSIDDVNVACAGLIAAMLSFLAGAAVPGAGAAARAAAGCAAPPSTTVSSTSGSVQRPGMLHVFASQIMYRAWQRRDFFPGAAAAGTLSLMLQVTSSS